MFIVYAILVFLVLVFVHELGHFLAARAVGIRVREFAIGMGPKIVSKQKGETLFSLRAIPVGGFCSMEGEDEESDDPNAFNNKPASSRALVLVAGSLMNILLAVVILIIVIFAQGEPQSQVKEVEVGSPAAVAGLSVGDTILAINDIPVEKWSDVTRIANEIIMEEESKNPSSSADNSGDNAANESENEEFVPTDFTINLSVETESGEKKTITTALYTFGDNQYKIGVTPTTKRSPGFAIRSIGYGARATWNMTKMMYEVLGQLITGHGKLDDLTGIIGIVKTVGDTAEHGFIYVVQLAALISLNLGIINLLPFPALDGGRIVFLIVRLFTGKKISDSFEGAFHFVGFIILIGFMVFITIRDVDRFIL